MRSYFWLAGAIFFSVSVQASTVYDNGSASSSASNVSTLMVADDFRLNHDSIITGAGIYAFGDYGTDTPWDGTVDYAIFQGGDTKPGTLISSGKGQFATREVTRDLGYPDGAQYRFNFLFEEQTLVKANTTYWFGAHIGSEYGYSYWYWYFTDSNSGAGSVISYKGTMDNWGGYNGDRAFFLTGSAVESTVPEPAAGGMVLAAGLVLLIWGRSRSVRMD